MHESAANPNQPSPAAPPEPRRFSCRHIMASGSRCGSPALKGEEFCYYHHTSRRRAPDPRTHPRQLPADEARNHVVDLDHLPEDRASILLSIHEIVRRLGRNQLDARRAGILIYGLQNAAMLLPKLPRATTPSDAEPALPLYEIVDDPDLGPLAPISEFITDDEARKTLMQKFIEYRDRPPQACKQCAHRAITDANKCEGRRLMAELNRRRAANLPEYDPPLDFYTPYPADEAWGAEERRLGISTGVPLQNPRTLNVKADR